MSDAARPIESDMGTDFHRSRFESAQLLHLRSTLRCLTARWVAGNSGHWLRGVLHSVRVLAEADKAAAFTWLPDREPAGYGDGVSQDAVAAYLNRFAAIDMARRGALERDAEVWSLDELWPRDQFQRSEYFHAFALPFRLHDTVAFSIRLPARRAEVQLAFYQEYPSPPAVTRWRQNLLEALLPAVRVAIQAHLAEDGSRTDLGSVLDVTGQALVLFDLSGREMRTNPVMRRALAQDPERSRVEASLRQVAGAVLASLAADQPDSPDKQSDGRRCEVATSMAAYRLRGNPVGHNAFGHPSAVMVSLDRVAFQIPAPDSLRARFGLTIRELQVASLIMHRLSNSEISRMLSISPHTARHHTQSVLAKLGVRSRKALRRLVSEVGTEPPR